MGAERIPDAAAARLIPGWHRLARTAASIPGVAVSGMEFVAARWPTATWLVVHTLSPDGGEPPFLGAHEKRISGGEDVRCRAAGQEGAGDIRPYAARGERRQFGEGEAQAADPAPVITEKRAAGTVTLRCWRTG